MTDPMLRCSCWRGSDQMILIYTKDLNAVANVRNLKPLTLHNVIKGLCINGNWAHWVDWTLDKFILIPPSITTDLLTMGNMEKGLLFIPGYWVALWFSPRVKRGMNKWCRHHSFFWNGGWYENVRPLTMKKSLLA